MKIGPISREQALAGAALQCAACTLLLMLFVILLSTVRYSTLLSFGGMSGRGSGPDGPLGPGEGPGHFARDGMLRAGPGGSDMGRRLRSGVDSVADELPGFPLAVPGAETNLVGAPRAGPYR